MVHRSPDLSERRLPCSNLMGMRRFRNSNLTGGMKEFPRGARAEPKGGSSRVAKTHLSPDSCWMKGFPHKEKAERRGCGIQNPLPASISPNWAKKKEESEKKKLQRK